MIPLIGIAVFGSVFLAAFALLTPRQNAVRRRIRGDERFEELPESFNPNPARGRRSLARPFLRSAGSGIARLLPQNVIASVDARLAMANDPWSLPGFLAMWLLSALVGVGIFAYVLASAEGMTSLQTVTMGIAVVGFAAILPYALLRRRARARQKAIQRSLPDAIDLLYTSVEAGLGVDAAFALVVERTEGPLAEAFALYLRQVGLGRDRRAALAEVAARTGVRDFTGVANAINQGEELGTTIGDVLRVQSEDLRRLRRQRAETAAQRAPVLMTIPLALCFLPAMGAVVIVPSVLNLIEFAGNLG